MLGLCQLDACGVGADKCYALKAERQYKAVIPHRMKQMEWWDSGCVALATDFTDWQNKQRKPVTAVRLGEAGDFRHAGDVSKFADIARLCQTVTWYCYTARKDLFDQATLGSMPPNVVINGSGWMAHNNFVILAGSQAGTKVDCVCPGDCRKCSRCLERWGDVIGVKLH
jgi:hypothetical protein